MPTTTITQLPSGGALQSGDILPAVRTVGGILTDVQVTTPTIVPSAQAINTVYAGPSTGVSAVPTFRALVQADIPTLSAAVITGGTIDGTPIGNTTTSSGKFTTLAASSTVSGTGFSTYLASPPAIGGTTAAAGSFTTLSASSTVSGSGFSTYLASPPAIGGTAPAAVNATTLQSTGLVTVGHTTATTAGGTTAAALLFGTTSGFGIYYGSGAPTITAAQGSLYIRSDGSSTSTRLYVNTTGSTTWTNFTSAT